MEDDTLIVYNDVKGKENVRTSLLISKNCFPRDLSFSTYGGKVERRVRVFTYYEKYQPQSEI